MIRLLKIIAQKSFNDGLSSCNKLGKILVGQGGMNRLLDVGCGPGNLTIEFAESAMPKELYGIEFVDDFVQQAESRGIICTKHDMNSRWNYTNDYFDLVLSSQSIEHVHNSRGYLEECYRVLRGGGQLIVLTENLASWINIGALLFGWQPFSTTNINGWSLGNPFIWHADEYKDVDFLERWQATGVGGTVGHVRVLTYRGLIDLMEKVGFKNISIHTRGYLPL
jgi:SAM-dependent methyltransferase